MKRIRMRPSLVRRMSRNASWRERAAAVVEFAVVLPLLLTVLFGIIEYGWVFMVRQALQTAAREGCRLAVLQTTDDPYVDVIERVNQVMAPTGLTTYDIDMTHADGVNPIETVTVRIPFADVSLMGNFFGPRSGNIGGTCSMRKEGWTEAD